ncbi:MAG: right-handed parallel beta-helix repeat-containing protein, partial [Verrucomicrobiae bacterium]|nr:right-handed parallel beta-helix repeat-containing protein [Verrucomicrobiae bacterium]
MKIPAILSVALFFGVPLQAEDVVDNLANPNSSQLVLDATDEMAAQAFTSGPGFTTLDSVTVRLRHFVPGGGSSTAQIQLWGGDGDVPDTFLKLLGTENNFVTDDEFTFDDFGSLNALLLPDTRYWIVVSYSAGDFEWRNTADGTITPASTGTLPEVRATSADNGSNWTPFTTGNFQKMKVVATPVPGITVTTSADDKDTPPDGSLRKAIADAAEGATITFDLPDGDRTIVLDGAELAIDKSLIIDASSLPGGVVISGDRTGDGPSADDSRIFNITGTSIVVLDSLTITEGRTPDSGDSRGGGIRSLSTTNVTLRDCTVSHNRARGEGGGMFCGGPMTLSRCTVSHNRAGEDGGAGSGGGIRADVSETTILNSTVSHNRAGARTDGEFDGNGGGGIIVGGTLHLVNSTVTANHAGKGDTGKNGGGGGGIAGSSSKYTVFLHNSIVAGNFVGEAGDGGSPGQGPDF